MSIVAVGLLVYSAYLSTRLKRALRNTELRRARTEAPPPSLEPATAPSPNPLELNRTPLPLNPPRHAIPPIPPIPRIQTIRQAAIPQNLQALSDAMLDWSRGMDAWANTFNTDFIVSYTQEMVIPEDQPMAPPQLQKPPSAIEEGPASALPAPVKTMWDLLKDE